jgi:hypothetical protein
MAETALREPLVRSALLEIEPDDAQETRTVLSTSGETLAFSALLREVLGDLRKDPAFMALNGPKEARTTSLEPAA